MSTNDSGYMVRKLLTPISHYLKDDDVTEIIFNKPGVAYLKTTKGDRREDVPDLTESNMNELLRSIAVYNQTKESSLNYFILPDGERCTSTLR